MNPPPLLRMLMPKFVGDSTSIAPLQFTLSDTGRLLAMSVSTVRRLIDRGELVSVGSGKLRRVTLASIVAYQARHADEDIYGP